MKIEGYIRLGAAVPKVTVADVDANVNAINELIDKALKHNVSVLAFPELSVTGYTCADLFGQRLLLEKAAEGISRIARKTLTNNMLVCVGAPLLVGTKRYNCAVFMAKGRVLAIVPKSYLPNYQEFYEKRWFESGLDATETSYIVKDSELGDYDVPFGLNLLIRHGNALISSEICEDLWVPVPPSSHLVCNGANVILNLSATDELIGKHAYLLQLIKQQSARCRCAYVYASAGPGESSTDLVYAGNAIIAANGSIAAESPRFQRVAQLSIADVDLERMERDRTNTGTFSDCSSVEELSDIRIIGSGCKLQEIDHQDLKAYVDPMPFVPSDKDKLEDHCAEILNIQAAGLAQRLSFTHCKNLTVGISGGLDSTLALLVAVRAFDLLGLDRKGISGITMPGFGTTDRTHNNSWRLMTELGVTPLEIPIGEAVNLHFRDIGHDPSVTDVTYENSQARMRTLILMDYANKTNGMVLGTGDLSELALGWCTYNGDHMSMYGVNTSVPKTLVRHLVSYEANACGNETLRMALEDIIDTPISPELLPADKGGNIAQKTEDLVGPYELHDFFLYQTLRFGFEPKKVYALALNAFAEKYDADTIKHWLKTFYRRFFSQQFKRSCMPDGPKTGSVCLSPRGDWRMPSDASSAMWLKAVEEI